MNKAYGHRTILSVELTRTDTALDATPLYVCYKMTKMTPFGMLEASAKVLFSTFVSDGPAVTDGAMLKRLSATINSEETSVLIEVGANSDFGTTSKARNTG